MASDDIKIRLKAFLDSSGAQKDIDSFVDKNQKKPIDVKVNVDIDANDSQQKIQSTINKIRGHNAIRFPVEIDTKGMSDAFQSFNQQIENYERKIKDAGGIIKKMDIAPHFETAVWDDGEEHIEKTYKALITYQTAVGETIQQIITLNTATGEISETTGKMSVDFEKQRKDFTQLASAVESYTAKLNALKEKSRAILGGTADTNSFKALIDSIDFSKVGNIDELDAMVAKLKQAQAEFDRLNASITNKKLAGTSIEQINQNLERIPDRIAEIRSRFSDIQMPDTIRQQLEAVEQQLKNIRNIEAPDQFIAAYNQITQVLDTIPSKLKVIQAEQKQMTQNALEQQRAQDRLNSLIARYQASATRYSAFKSDSSLLTEYRALGNTIEQLQQRLQQVKQTGVWDKSLTADIASANAQMSQFNNHVVMAGKNAKSLKDTFKEAFSTFGTWLSATSIIMKLIQGIRNAITAVKDLDAAMVNLKKVTNETDQAYTEYLKNVGKQAQRIGATMTDLIESGATFAKLGYSFKESQGLAEVATIFANVGDFNNINTATNGLITAMKSFNIAADDAMSIADKINEVANRFAVSADDLTTGLANSASALSLAGNTIDQTIAMITAMSEITQNASESGNALKILSMRLRGAKAELQSAGEETDGMCESTAKLREKILALTGSVDIMADEAGTQFKSTYQIMQEIAAVWNDLTDINQAALLETIAGKLRGNSISALLTNMAQANKVLETSLDSAGSALNEHEKWLESIAAKEAQMKAAWQDFADSLINQDAIKGWYDGLTGILNILTKIVDLAGSLPTLLGGLATFFSVKGNLFGTAKDSAGNIVGRIGQYTMGSGFSFSKLFNGEVNADIINQYTEALNNGATAADAMKQAVMDASGQVVSLNGATRAALATQNGAANAMKQLGIETTATTGKMIAQRAAVMALNVVLNIGLMAAVTALASGISALIQGIGAAIDKARNPLKYLQEEYEILKTDYSDISSQVDDVNSELDSTGKRIDELQNKGSLTFVEKEELQRLQESNNELDRRLANLKEQQELKQKDIAQNVKSKYKEGFQNTRYDNKDDPWYVWADATEYTRETAIGWDLESYQRVPMDNVRKRLVDAMEEYYQFLDEYPYEDEFSNFLRQQIESIYKVINPGKYKTEKFTEIVDSEDFKYTIQELKNAAANGELSVEMVESYSALNQALSDVGISAEEAVEQFYALAKAEEEATEAASSFESTNKRVQETIGNQTKLAEIAQKQGYASSITEEQYQEITAMGEDYAKCVENINGYIALNIDKVNELVQAKYQEQKAEVAVSKAQAMVQYKQNLDEISLLQTQLTLLADGEDELAASIRNQIGVLQSQNGTLLDDISGYERLASQLEYATSAYKKWLDAQNAPEAGDAYDNLRTAMKQIEEGQESGKIGTVKYRAAVELLVPDGRDVDSYMKTLERYLTEDSTGLQNFIDDMYKRANPFLSKDSSGRYSFMEGVTVEDIAQGLGLTEEVAQYMLMALKDYGWDVSIFDQDYKDSELLKNYEASVAKLEEAQQRLEELRKNATATAEEQAEAEQAVIDAQKEVDTAAVAAGLQEEKTAIEQLKDELAELQAAYDTLKEFKLTGDIDPNFTAYAEAIQGAINLLNSMPDDGYTLNISNGGDLASAVEQAGKIEAAIASLDGLATNGVISYELAASVNDLLTAELTRLKGEIDTYNSKNINPKEANITVNAIDKASDAIKGITDGPYTADIHVKVNEDDKEKAEEEIQELLSGGNNDSPDNSASGETNNGDGYWFSGQYFDDDEEEVSLAQLEAAQAAAQEAQAAAEKAEAAASEAQAAAEEVQDSTGSRYDQKGEQTGGLPDGANLLMALGAKAIDDLAGTTLLDDYLNGFPNAQAQKAAEDQNKIVPFKPEDYGFEPFTEALEEATEEAVQGGVEQGTNNSLDAMRDPNVWGTIPLDFDADTTQAEDAVDDLAEKAQSAWEQLPNNFQKVDAFEQELFNTDDIDQAIANLGTTWEKVRDAYTGLAEDMPFMDKGITPTINEEEFKKQIEEIYQLNYDGPTFGLNADPSKAIKTADAAQTKINNMTATMTINGKYGSILGGLLGGYPKLAKGTHFAKEEDAIVGESGIETWIHDGKFYTVGHNGAELVHLSRGDQVLNPGETRALFKGKQISGNAYAEGTGGTNLLGSLIDAGKNLASGIWNGFKNLLGNAGKKDVGGGGNDTGGNKGNKNNNGNNGGGNNKKKQDEEYLKSLENLVDWIPTALENLKKKTDEYIDYADKAVGYMLKNANLDNAIKNIDDEINLNLQGYEKYMQQANEIAQRMNLSDDIVNKIQNGTIDIESYDEDTRKVISAYQKWYDLANGCRDAVGDLRKQQTELAKQKLDNIAKDYENRISLLGTIYEGYQKQIDKKIASGKEVTRSDYSDMLTNTQERIDMLQQERDAMSNELQSLVDAGTIQEGSDDWYKYTNQIKEFDSAIADAEISMEDLKDSINGITLTNIQTAMSMLNQIHSTIQGFMDLRSAQGKTATANDYRDLISSGSKQIKNLEMQNAALLKQQEGLDVLSEKYQEIQKQINENALAILSTKAKQEEWNDAIIDLEIDRLQKQNTQYKSQLQLMDAIENLEKSKQRRALVYREGGHSAP